MSTNRFRPICSPHKYLLRKTHVQVIYTSIIHINIDTYFITGIVHLNFFSKKHPLHQFDPAPWCFPQPVARAWHTPKSTRRVVDGEHRGMTRVTIRTRTGEAGRGGRWPIERWSWPRRGWEWWSLIPLIYQLSLIICVYIRDYIYYPVIMGIVTS